MVVVQRSESLWEVLPPAITFWEPLGLAPAGGSKNVTGYCIYPVIEGVILPIHSLLEEISSTYENLKLGTHMLGLNLDGFEEGLVPVTISSGSNAVSAMRSIRDKCIHLGRSLASLQFATPDETTPKSLIIYLVNPFLGAYALGFLCDAFWAMFEEYTRGLRESRRQASAPDLVLQIISMDFVASFCRPVEAGPLGIAKLVREVYDRCPPSELPNDESLLRTFSGPSIHLNETVARSVPFKLVVEPPQSLLYEHVAYACSLDGRWIAASWTDSTGKCHANLTYSLARGRTFVDVAREIWGICMDIMQARRVAWRVYIARLGVMEREEMSGKLSHLRNLVFMMLTGISSLGLDYHSAIFLRCGYCPGFC
jgi:mediator of RNA polymerase II transcription subunit 13, fungi type